MTRLRDIIEGAVVDLAAALVGRRDAAANIEHAVDDRLRSTLASIFGFEDVPPDSYIEQAARHHVARIATLEQHWMSCARRLRDCSAENVKLAFEADDVRRRLAEREHQIETARQMLRDGQVEGAAHYLWSVTTGVRVVEKLEQMIGNCPYDPPHRCDEEDCGAMEVCDG